jgi:hypothetical protein
LTSAASFPSPAKQGDFNTTTSSCTIPNPFISTSTWSFFGGGGAAIQHIWSMVLHIAQIASHEGCYCYLPCSDWTPPSTDCSSCTCQQTCRTCT